MTYEQAKELMIKSAREWAWASYYDEHGEHRKAEITRFKAFETEESVAAGGFNPRTVEKEMGAQCGQVG